MTGIATASWAPWVTPILELGQGTQHNAGPVATWDHSLWDRLDTGGWSAASPLWVELDPCSIRSIATVRGRNRWLDKFDAGTISVTVDDRAGQFSWVDQPSSNLPVRTGMPIRLSALENASGLIFPVFTGFVESVSDSYAPDLSPQITINGQDALAQFARIQLPADASTPGDGELSGARIARLLNLAEWPSSQSNLDAGEVPIQATDYSDPIYDQLELTADSEGGAFYAARDGTARFRDRYWLRDSTEAKNVQATIGGPDQDVCAASYETTRDGADIVNDVQLTRVGGVMQRVVDMASIGLFRRRAMSRTDYLCSNDADVVRLANRQLVGRSAGRPRIPSVDIAPLDGDEFHFALTVEFGWRLEIVYDAGTEHFYPGTPWSTDVIVQGISHKIDTTGWTTTLRVDDASAFPQEGWDHGGGWDVQEWAEAL
jgi:hypothetical protein